MVINLKTAKALARVHRKCLLLTQSGHWVVLNEPRLKHLNCYHALPVRLLQRNAPFNRFLKITQIGMYGDLGVRQCWRTLASAYAFNHSNRGVITQNLVERTNALFLRR